MYHKLRIILENHWYNNKNNLLIDLVIHILLIPFSVLFLFISRFRYYLYKFKLLIVKKLPVPIVVVGNISVGGVGKTPLTLHLVNLLLSNGLKVGVILRGYKGNTTIPIICNKDSDVRLVGDEALIYANVGIPVCVFKNRYQAGLALIESYPELDMILMDDGLQHYKLFRDYEIVVVDTTRYFTNKFVLPNGPLRETISRINHVNMLVLNGEDTYQSNIINVPKTQQLLQLKNIYNPILNCYYQTSELNKLKVTVMVATGNPERFCQFLEKNNVKISKRLFFPDHYYYQAHDIPNDTDIILVTTKDYTKLKQYNNKKICIVNSEVVLDNNKIINDLIALATMP
jgi:tetraacyldisaccharide 4'-kinase